MNEKEKIFLEKITLRVLELINSTGKADYRLEQEIGISRSTIQSLRNNISHPKIYALAQIANYFNVSLDYLVGRETEEKTTQRQQNTANNVTTDPLLNRISQLNELQRAKVAAYVDGLQGAETSIEKAFRQGQKLGSEKRVKEDTMLQQQKKFN